MTKNAGQPESIVKERLRRSLGKFFYVREEVTTMDGKGRIDYLSYPRPEIEALGWIPGAFGIEAKGHDLDDHRKRTAIRVVYQAMQYAGKQFRSREGQPLDLTMVLLYPKVSILLGLGEKAERQETLLHGVEYALVRLAALANVGELIIDDSHFEVNFNGARYFHSQRGMSTANPLAARTTRASR